MSTIGEIATFIGRPGDDVRDPRPDLVVAAPGSGRPSPRRPP
jgi:hypothetical protein